MLLVRSISPALFLAIAGVAHAAPTTTPASPTSALAVDVEVGGGADAVRVTLTLAGEHGCGSASTHRGPVHWDVGVCRDGGTAEAPVLVFNVERVDGSPPATRVQKVRVSSRLQSGKRAVVGRIAQPDGAPEVAATAREP